MALLQAVTAFPLQCRNLQKSLTGWPNTDTMSGLQTYALLLKEQGEMRTRSQEGCVVGRTEDGLGYL